MRNTIDGKLRNVRKWCWIVATAIVISGLTLVCVTPFLRYGQLNIDSNEFEARTREVRERAEAIRKQLKKERDQRHLSEENARKLIGEIEDRENEQIVQHLKNIRKVFNRLEEENARRREQMAERSVSERLALKLDPLRRNMERTLAALDSIKQMESNNSQRKQLPDRFIDSLEEDRTAFEALLEKLDDGHDPKTLSEIARIAQEIVEKTGAVESPDNKTFDGRRRSAFWAARDSANDARKLMNAPEEMTAFEQKSESDASKNQIKHLPKPITETIEQPDNKSVADLYDAAKVMETLLNNSLDESRAAELAMRQGSEIEEARAKLIPSSAQLKELPSLKTQKLPDTIGELNKRREAVTEAARQIAQLNQRADEASQQLLGISSDRPSTISTNASLNQQLQNSLIQVAQKKQHGTISDISGLMRLAMIQSGTNGSDANEHTLKNTEGSLDSGSDNSSERKANLDLKRTNVTANALPGRRFSEASSRKGWLYLDTWYIIGPWDNHGDLRSFEIPHPPENEINFDGIYSGKIYTKKQAQRDALQGIDRNYTVGQARALSWRFIQSDTIRTDVPDETSDATYYLFTDVFFEEERDMLIAIGSDDAAKVWINGVVVWMDENQSRWELGEHFSKVFFKKGYNSILVRLENGPTRCELSFLIVPPMG